MRRFLVFTVVGTAVGHDGVVNHDGIDGKHEVATWIIEGPGPDGPGVENNSKEMIVCDENEVFEDCSLCSDPLCDGTPMICRTCSHADNCCHLFPPACKCKPGFVRLKDEIHG